ncbi:MAG: MNIO family bufferin maturase [Beijerinckiaceae bacterium]
MRVSQLPLSAGASFKPEHFAAISAAPQPLGFFEVHAENYMGGGGTPHAQLKFLREHYALSVHGIGLNIGSREPLDRAHLARLKELCDRYQPKCFSEHLAWSSHAGIFFNDLLPLPYTERNLRLVIDHVDEAQNSLRRHLLLENPATYVRFEESTIPETEFLAAIARASGCGLLLDVNNVFVSARNHATSAGAYLEAFPLGLVGEIHLAGHFETADGQGSPLCIDAHGSPVAGKVFALFDSVIARTGPLPTLIEWDNDVPEWPVLRAEVLAAEERLKCVRRVRAAPAAA